MTVLVGPLVALALALAVADPAVAPARFHDDPAEVEAAALDAARAVFRDESAALRRALDRLEEHCRTLNPEQAALFGESIVNADRAYHMALARGREFAGAGEDEPAFKAYVGVLQVCRTCHEFARAEGRWHPAAAPSDPSLTPSN